jgi:hypothetical protein
VTCKTWQRPAQVHGHAHAPTRTRTRTRTRTHTGCNQSLCFHHYVRHPLTRLATLSTPGAYMCHGTMAGAHFEVMNELHSSPFSWPRDWPASTRHQAVFASTDFRVGPPTHPPVAHTPSTQAMCVPGKAAPHAMLCRPAGAAVCYRQAELPAHAMQYTPAGAECLVQLCCLPFAASPREAASPAMPYTHAVLLLLPDLHTCRC